MGKLAGTSFSAKDLSINEILGCEFQIWVTTWKIEEIKKLGIVTFKLWLIILKYVKNIYVTKTVCFLQILGRWHFQGIGKNLSESLLDQCGKHIPNASVAHEVLEAPRHCWDYGQIVEISH